MAKLDEKKFAEDYGYALAFLKAAGPEIYGLFKKAMGPPAWTPAKFEAAVKASKWYQTHGETYRQQLALEKTDPATYAQNLNAQIAALRDKAATMGASLSADQIRKIADTAIKFGWNESQLSDTLSKYVTFTSANGQAADNVASMQQLAWRNGIKMSDRSLQSWAQKIARGDTTVDDFAKYARKSAASLAPVYADELKAGMDLYDIATPYMQTMASTLELNPADISLFDPTIRGALSARGQDGKPAGQSLWEFEQDVKNDPRWLKTKNAQDSVMSTARKVLTDFGLVGA